MNLESKKDAGAQYPVPISENQSLSTEIGDVLLHYDASPTFADFLEIILRRKWLIIGIFALFVLPALPISFMIKPVYQAVGTIEINPQAPKVTKFENVLSDRLGKDDVYYATQIELLSSAPLARRVIHKPDLADQPGFNAALDRQQEKKFIWRISNKILGLKETILGAIGSLFQPATEAVPTDAASTQVAKRDKEAGLEWVFAKKLKVQQKEDTSLIQIRFDSTDPVLASKVVNTLIDGFIDWQMDRRIDAAKTAKQQLEKQIKMARTDMEKADEELNEFSKEQGIVSLDSRLNLVYAELEKINQSLAKAESERIEKGEFYKYTVDSGDISSSPLVVHNTLIETLRKQYIDLMGDYEKLSVYAKDDYPAVKNIKAKMLAIGKRIDAEQQRLLASFKNDYEAAMKKEKAFKASAEEKKVLALQLKEKASRFKVLEREVEINKQIFQSLLERSKEIDANVGTDLSNIKVVDLARVPLRPYKPRILRNLLIACILGLFGGFGLAFLREYADRTIRRIDEVSDRHMIPILGVLPLVSKEEGKKLDGLVRVSPASLFSEAIRAAKASVQIACTRQKGEPVKSILITGTTAGEGKTTVAANLAQAYAATGERVLIMDGDLRRPRLGKIFAQHITNGHYGLSHYLNGLCELDKVISETDVPNLYFINAGKASSKLAELLASSNMKNMMKTLEQDFDRIIVDSPPFGVFADVLLLAGQVDAVILITALGRTHREDLRIFRRKIMEANGYLLGSIVNKLDLSRYNGSYYQKHYRSYYSTRFKDRNLPVEVDFDL
jgi:succinoglycan biosynthesis transport protein ExoP